MGFIYKQDLYPQLWIEFQAAKLSADLYTQRTKKRLYFSFYCTMKRVKLCDRITLIIRKIL